MIGLWELPQTLQDGPQLVINGSITPLWPWSYGPRLPTARPPSYLELSFRDVAKDAMLRFPSSPTLPLKWEGSSIRNVIKLNPDIIGMIPFKCPTSYNSYSQIAYVNLTSHSFSLAVDF